MTPVTEISIFPMVDTSKENLKDTSCKAGRLWNDYLTILSGARGYQRHYWGRQVESPENIQLHVEWESLQHHIDFTASPEFSFFDAILEPLITSKVIKRHALLSTFTPRCESLGKGAPFTGTAIYLSPKPTWVRQSLQWSQIVRNVPGFRGYAGGPVLEPVDGHERAYILLVGWDTVEAHDAYHHTQHFKRIGYKFLLDHCEGYTNYGHIAFENEGRGDQESSRL